MPVSVKEYLDSMKSVSSSSSSSKSKNTDTKNLALLSNLIEALAYESSMKFKQKTLKSQQDKSGTTGKQILEALRAQEKLIDKLVEGEKLSSDQSKELVLAIDRFYELAGSAEINYKKLASSLEKIVLTRENLPEAVKTRLINDSRDAHIIGQQDNSNSSPLLKILKRIKFLAEDSFEMSKQFGKKLFVTLDVFKAGIIGAFDNLKTAIEDNSIIGNVVDAIKSLGLAWMVFQGQFKEGNFKFGQIFKQFKNLQEVFKIMSNLGGAGKLFSTSFNDFKGMFKGIKVFFKSFGEITKLTKSLGLTKGLSSFGKAAGKGLAKGLGKSALKKIPLIGTVLSIWMAIERWQKGDYLGAFIELGSGVASIFPGVGTLISIGLDLLNLGRDVSKMKKQKSDKSSNKSNSFKWPWQKDSIEGPFGDAPINTKQQNTLVEMKKANITGPFGDAPIKWQNESGGYSPKGLTQNAKTATNNLNSLLGGGLVVTSAYRDPQKMMGLWNSATPIPGSKNRRNIYGNEMADPRRSNHRFGTAIDIPMSLYKRIGAKKFKRLANKAGFNLVYPEHSAVHLEVPKSGKIAKTNDNYTIDARSNIEPLGEDQSEMTAYGEAQQVQTFDDLMNAFNKFNEDIIAGVPANASKSSSMTAPPIDTMSAGTPQATIAEASKATLISNSNRKPPQQAIQTVSNTPEHGTLDTEIRDTDLALLNSLIFQ